jgi:hypothetical protein
MTLKRTLIAFLLVLGSTFSVLRSAAPGAVVAVATGLALHVLRSGMTLDLAHP